MSKIELYPTLEHCIETTARQEFNRLVEDCLAKGSVDRDSEAKIEMLRSFLETADFHALRQKSDFYLIVGEKIRFVLADSEGTASYRLEVIQGPLFE